MVSTLLCGCRFAQAENITREVFAGNSEENASEFLENLEEIIDNWTIQTPSAKSNSHCICSANVCARIMFWMYWVCFKRSS